MGSALGWLVACFRHGFRDWPATGRCGNVRLTGLSRSASGPGTASICTAWREFLTLEDETGVSNIVVWKRTYEMFRSAVSAGRLLRVTGRIERDSPVIHIIATRIEDLSPQLSRLARRRQTPSTRGRADGAVRPMQGSAQHPGEQAKLLFPSRVFTNLDRKRHACRARSAAPASPAPPAIAERRAAARQIQATQAKGLRRPIPQRRPYDRLWPRVSAACAPRCPMGSGAPVVESRRV
ncbi:OB-fold nucleic acid binding domain-containing protein [Plastorhodobacter daqingensis]|uniref:OB-fold nucleic acid binding domain-containing protein n=1 Tax=Plastorhodobacter daqingensis TaxID=1387281 RepID=A0ABW2US73_9RHOB